ncbi:MAG TPA: hypothetical protein VMH01_04135 [Puia sp.]|nr:hypothetical protein [Puia sp.]
MKPKTYIRYFILIVIAITGLILFSYSRNNATTKESCQDSEKSGHRQSEFVIWESLSHSLIGCDE